MLTPMEPRRNLAERYQDLQRNGCSAKFTSQVIIKATASKVKKCPSSSPYEVFWQSIKISGILWSLEAELPRGRKFPAVVEDHGERVAIMGGLMLSGTNHYSSNCF